MDPRVTEIYGNKVRLRVCGICEEKGRLLMVNHSLLGERDFWAPPGGGVEFGESLQESLKREFLEETGLEVEVGRFLFGSEYVNPPLHSVELFFKVGNIGGNLSNGNDPELSMIKEVRFFTPEDIRQLDRRILHGIFSIASYPDGFADLRGFYRI
jgi:8-oxo-dGTP diphosphatase